MKLAQRIALKYIRTKFNLLTSVSKKKAAAKAFELFCTPQHRTKKPLPPLFERAKPIHFIMNGDRVNGWQWNHPSSNKILILHGFESSATSFAKYIEPLITKGYEVLAFDALAHGRSEGKRINALIYKKMIVEIQRIFGPINTFIAHSFGGLALSLAMEETTHDEKCKIVLIAPATETTTAIDSFFKFLRLDRSLRNEFDKTIVKIGGVSPAWYSVSRAMKHIRAKILWVHDKDDDVTPYSDVIKIKQQQYSNIQFYITEGLGHRKIYRDNKVAQAIMNFL
jgi:pimeloyl-ACP methyl ester carboxylesterase